MFNFSQIPAVKEIGNFIIQSTDEMIIISILLAVGFIYFKNKTPRIVFFALSIPAALLFLNHFSETAFLITVFVPTIIHVYFFTLLFMIYGNLNSKSRPGIVAIVLLILVPIIIALSNVNPQEYMTISDFTKNSFDSSGFGILNRTMGKSFSTDANQYSFLSIIGIKMQIFIAFAYLYHYLNWFSKTSIIRWDKNMSKAKIITILSIWICSVALYLYNFKVGVIV